MRFRKRNGLGQIEVVVSTILVGVLMVSSFSTIAASRRSQMYESDRVRGLTMADSLMAEILQWPVRDPDCDCGFGLEIGESGPNRLSYDDVDDYDSLSESPPKTRDGTPCEGYGDLVREVNVAMVTTADWNVISSSFTGVYRITVRVLRGQKEVCRIVGHRTSGSAGAVDAVFDSSVNAEVSYSLKSIK